MRTRRRRRTAAEEDRLVVAVVVVGWLVALGLTLFAVTVLGLRNR